MVTEHPGSSSDLPIGLDRKGVLHVLPVAIPNKEIMLLPMFLGRWKIRNDQSGTSPFGNIQKAICGLFHTKEVQQQSYAGNPEAFVPKNDQKVDQNTLEIGRKLGRVSVEVL